MAEAERRDFSRNESHRPMLRSGPSRGGVGPPDCACAET